MAYNKVKEGVDKIKSITAGTDVQTISNSFE
jgi:hypothetical protein